MRLFRRTLLCLVVGVAAFGAAGWVLRPSTTWSPTWETNIGPGRFFIVDPVDPSKPSEQICLDYYEGRGRNPSRQTKCVVSIDAKTGAQLTEWPFPNDDPPAVLSDGRILTTYQHLDGIRITYTRFRLYERDGKDVFGQTRPGMWQPIAVGAKAWDFDEDKGQVLVRLADLATGQTRTALTIKDASQTRILDLSRDGKRLVVWRSTPRTAGGSLETWAIDGTRINRVWFDREVGSAQFDGADGITFQLSESNQDFSKKSYWHYDPIRGIVRRIELADEPPGARGPVQIRRVRGAGRGSAFVAFQLEPQLAWIASDDGRRTAGWRPVPFPVLVRKDHTGFLWGINATFVPGSTAMIASCSEPKADSNKFDKMAPPTTGWPEAENHVLWYDGDQGIWHELPCSRQANPLQVRADAVITCEESSNGDYLLQSWPLPPPDTRSQALAPALAIAALCMAGTWWLCAWRYRRRMQRASAGTA